MEEHPRIAPQRRHIQRRAEELQARIPFMPDLELRWTVRLLRDCLPPGAAAESLRDYSEHLELHPMRRVVADFVPAYTRHALEALEAVRFAPGTSLQDWTEEELQGASAAEKWALLQREPMALRPHQARRELARLFLCPTFDLFHDPALGEAAVEFNGYLDLLQRLGALPDGAVADLVQRALAALRGRDLRDPAALEGALAEVREDIGRSAGLAPPFQAFLLERMARWPPMPPGRLPEVVDPGIREAVQAMGPEQLRTSLRVLLEVMGLEEQRREMAPLTARYRGLGEMGAEALRDLLPRLSMRLGDRTVCDFALRYREGRLWARERVDPLTWRALPYRDKLRLLEADNQAMDRLQMARHLARLLCTRRYELLFDAAYHVGLLEEPAYRRAVDRCMGEAVREEGLRELNGRVTRMMLELEALAPEAVRPARFEALRRAIAEGLGTGPPPKGG